MTTSSTKGTKTETTKGPETMTENLTPSQIAEELNLALPETLYSSFDNTGGGVMCIVVTPDEDPAVNSEIALYFGTAEGFLGWSDYYGEANGSWSHLVASEEDDRAWYSNEPITNSAEIVAKILETVKTYFSIDDKNLTDPETIVTCADRAITLIDMSEISDVLEDVSSLDQLADKVDWNHFLAEGCDHVTDGNLGSDEMIAHLNAVNVAADLMLQGEEPILDKLYNYLKISQVARGPHCVICDKVDADHGDETHPFAPVDVEEEGHPYEAEVYAAIHAQIEDLTPPEALEILDKVRADLKSEIRDFTVETFTTFCHCQPPSLDRQNVCQKCGARWSQ